MAISVSHAQERRDLILNAEHDSAVKGDYDGSILLEIPSIREKMLQILVIDDNHAWEPSGLVRLSKMAAWIS